MSFAALPSELQLLIITEALEVTPLPPPPPDPKDAERIEWFKPARTLDVGLAFSVAVVSPSCHDIVHTLLLRHVHIARPSALRQLFSTLSKRPDLAQRVKSIHLGPVKAATRLIWPMYSPSIIRSTLNFVCNEEVRTPTWCIPGDIFEINSNSTGCVNRAVGGALEVALDHLDVDHLRTGYSKAGGYIGLRAWAARLFLLQAALELYLSEMRRVDNAKQYKTMRYNAPSRCRISACDHKYPRLQIESTALSGHASSAARSLAEGETFTITEAQLWQQVERPGGPGDDFNHLTLFTSSTREALGMSVREWQRVRDGMRGVHVKPLRHSQWLWLMGYESYGGVPPQQVEPDSDVDDEPWPHAICSQSDDFDAGLSPRTGRTDKAEDLLNMARYIFSLCSRLTNLSVTGIFLQALPALGTTSLQSLTIGPCTRYWDRLLPSDAIARLKGLARLRIVGMVSKEEATDLAYKLPQLKYLEWETTEHRLPAAVFHNTICTLQGRLDVTASRKKPTKPSTVTMSLAKPEDTVGDKNDTSISLDTSSLSGAAASHPNPNSSQRPSHRRTHVLLRSRVTRAMRTEAHCTAWRDGSRVEGTLHRVKVIVSGATRFRDERGNVSLGRELAELYAKSQRWWLEGNEGEGMFRGEGAREKEKKNGAKCSGGSAA